MIHIRYLKQSDAGQPPEQRTVSFIVAGGQIEHAHKPSAWDRAKWCAAFFLSGLAIGAIATASVKVLVP
jgi:hypothetical protein